MTTTQTKTDRFVNEQVDVKRHGREIVLPSEPHAMRLDEAVTALQRKMQEEEAEYRVTESIEAFPLDGAIAFSRAIAQTYGWANGVPTPGFFGSNPPMMVNVEVAFGKYAQVHWGRLALPNVEGFLETGITEREGRPIFLIQGRVKKKNAPEIQALAELTRKLVREQSIYKGKAVKLVTNDDGRLVVDVTSPPRFIDTTKVDARELIFSDVVLEQIDTSLFTPIEHTQVCREQKVPLKRGVLLEGPYGCGKTLTAFITAQKCEANGWTFIMLDKVAGLHDALSFARQYSPAVVFAEDIDRTVSGERSVEIDDVLNTIDGVESKGTEIITILTSNHAENINRAMLRPGRLDAVITVHPPDAKAADRLMRLYARGLLAESEDVTEASGELAGQIPAVIRETVERAKLSAIRHTAPGQELRITGRDLLVAARGMRNHLRLLNPEVKGESTLNERMGAVMTEVVQAAVKGNGLYSLVTDVNKTVQQVKEAVC